MVEGQNHHGMPALREGAMGTTVPSPVSGTSGHVDGSTTAGGGTLALHYAAARGCLDCVRLLVDSTPDLSANTQMDNDVTPVYLAAQEGHLDVLKFLVLEAGGSLYVRAKDGMAPIHAASQMGCLHCVKWMIQDQGVDPNLRDGDGATPLHFAASRGHLDTVRWLLKHGARLSLDKYGKSPINDAAENQQVECLNVLVQHGASPDYQESSVTSKNSISSSSRRKSCSCSNKKHSNNVSQNRNQNKDNSDCSSCKSRSLNGMEPFYLHPPVNGRTVEVAHAPENGLYINPMNNISNNHRHSISSCSELSFSGNVSSESFYLHNPQEVIYNRVKDLFESTANNNNNSNSSNSLSALTVKVEVHSTSSGAGSDENLSCSDLSERSGDHDHDYEDIYIVREESKAHERSTFRSHSRDSGSHSRSGSISSSHSGCNVVVKLTKTTTTNNIKSETKHNMDSEIHLNSNNETNNYEEAKTKLGTRRSLPANNGVNNTNNNSSNGHSKVLKRVISVPNNINPPPPPPPPPQGSNGNFLLTEENDENSGVEIVEIVEEPTLKPSEIVKGMCRSMSALTAKRLNASCSDLTSTYDDGQHSAHPNLVNKQRVLPFVPPSFPGNGTGSNLIKPSEYLRSLGDKRTNTTPTHVSSKEFVESVTVETVAIATSGPPPPPLPDPEKVMEDKEKSQQPLSAISIHDLNSVQLRRTDKMVAAKTFSAPTRSMSLQCLDQAESYMTQKIDLIAELKMSRDITGIKKMKIEKAKTEESKEKEYYSEISKQFTATNFVDKIPDKDNSGNMIPAWKRQMLAKKAAEKAKKELEEQLQKEAEEKRLQSIPPWKRQLLAKKEEAEIKMKSTLYTPKVVDDSNANKSKKISASKEDLLEISKNNEDINNNNDVESINLNNKSEENEKNVSDGESTAIMPWRAQLRKTNSKLNLLD